MRRDCRSHVQTRDRAHGTIAGVAGRVLETFLAVLAPPTCAACDAGVRPGSVLCADCAQRLPWLTGRTCARCAQPAPCAPCPARRAAFAHAWAPLEHRGPARALVTALKFRGALACAAQMARHIAAALPPGLLDDAELVPVPRHPARRRAHGFDQAELLARALARETGRPVLACLQRHGPDRAQLGTGRVVRLAPDRIAVHATAAPPEVPVLVDDVHTTGATLDACARALREAGARSVVALTYTRAIRPD
jgi:predicted amidophosphoribosyltransferase